MTTSTNYQTRLDAEIRTYIDKCHANSPPDAATLTVVQQRELYQAMCQQFEHGRPAGLSSHDEMIDTGSHSIPVRHYHQDNAIASEACIMFLHGGGWVVGNLDTHDEICADLCVGTGLPVMAVDYRLAPEHTHPAAFEDTMTAYQHLSQQGVPIILVGDSAGANLAAALSHQLRASPWTMPAKQILIYPALGCDLNTPSGIEHAQAPLLTVSDMEFYYQLVSGGADFTQDVRLFPLVDNDFSDLPPTVIFAAECDPLASDGTLYQAKLQAAGVEAQLFMETGLIHGYLRARHQSQLAQASFKRIINACQV